MKKQITILMIISGAFLLSCNTEDNVDTLTDLLTEKQEAIVTTDAAADDVSEEMDYEIDFFTGSNQIVSDLCNNSFNKNIQRRWQRYLLEVGPEITVEPEGLEYPKTITLDYGDGIELVNGRIISGKIIVVLSDAPQTDGGTRTLGFEEFYVDSVHIEGAGLCTFTGTVETERIFNCEKQLTLTFPDGDVLTRTGTKIRTFAEGYETPYDISDDLITITGAVNCESAEESFSKTIVSPLIKTGTCRMIVEGTVLFTYNGEDFAELDYGDGTCDDVATITKDGETVQITIGQRRRFHRN